MHNIQSIKDQLVILENSIKIIKDIIDNEKPQEKINSIVVNENPILSPSTLVPEESTNIEPKSSTEENSLIKQDVKIETLNSSEFLELKSLLFSNDWPSAVDPELVCNINSDQDKEDRAEGIIDLVFDTPLKNLKFLDFGCGEGHVAKKILENHVSFSMGYDIKSHEKWEEFNKTSNLMLTDNWDTIKNKGPYDIILLYDVIDHIEGSDEDVIACLNKLKQVCTNNTLIYIRCHPFCSKHGSHVYKQINKAYIQLIFNEEEQKELGLDPLYIRKIIHPLMSYKNFFDSANLTFVKKDQIYKEKVDSFFIKNPLISKRIKENYKFSLEEELRKGNKFPLLQLEQQFVDYCLKLK